MADDSARAWSSRRIATHPCECDKQFMAWWRRRRNRREIERLIESRLPGQLLSLDGPTVIGGHELWSAATPKGTKFILTTRGRTEILDAGTIDSVIQALAQLQRLFALERVIALAVAATAIALVFYSLFLVVFDDQAPSVATLAILLGSSGLLMALSSLWLKAGGREFEVLLGSGHRLTVDHDGLGPTVPIEDEPRKGAADREERDG